MTTEENGWSPLDLPEDIMAGITHCGYKNPTEVQAKAIPIARQEKDLIVRSKTGTGKSAAFLIPALCRTPVGYNKPSSLVLCPSRELAIQVMQECTRLCSGKDLKITAIYGGVPLKPQQEALENGAEIIVGTPGRVLDHIKRGNLKLDQLLTATLDEADEMLSMGFYQEVTDILKRMPKSVQMLLFSATLEERLKKLIGRFLKEPEEIYISLDTDQASENVTHITYNYRTEYSKPHQFLYILQEVKPDKAIIFCNTKSTTAMIARFLSMQGYEAQDISSDLNQRDRERVMKRIKAGNIDYLVATDIAARGIDIQNLNYVFNYTLPEDCAIYLHRTGRTGRIGNKGTAISLVGHMERNSLKTLKTKYSIEFEERSMVSKEEAEAVYIQRQLKQLKAAPARPFEGYLPLAKHLKNDPMGSLLIAKAICGFFQALQEKETARQETPNAENAKESKPSKNRRRKRKRPHSKGSFKSNQSKPEGGAQKEGG